mgnify:CR=1 FL=1
MISCVPTLKGGFGHPFLYSTLYSTIGLNYFLPDAAATVSSNQIQVTSKQIQATS